MSVLFLNDWRNEKGKLKALPHITTKNKSFLRTAQQLKMMGIKNYAFPLCLYDPDLKDVDVFDLEEDTAENEILRTKVQIEARRNVWYYLRECIRIYEQGGSPVQFRLDRASTAMAWCFSNGLDYCGMAPRQTGKAQPLSSQLLSTTGWIEMGDVTYDTKLIAPDGNVTSVIGIYPQGMRDVYEVCLAEGQKTECCPEHLWNAYSKAWEERFRVCSLQDLLDSNDEIFLPVGGTLSKIISITYIGQKEVQCIEVDHPDHLYITDDYIVTHNTVCALSLTSWIMYSSGYEFVFGMYCKDNKLREENVKRVRSLGENLPKWWISEDKFKDKKNTTELFYNAMRTHYVTMVAQKDKSAADLQARGASMPALHIDELEYCASVGVSYPTMLASTGAARENARKNGKPHSNLITTTAGDPTKPECQEAVKILTGAMPFSEFLYDLENREKVHEVVQAASPQKMILGVFSHLQLGYDNQWLRDKINRNRMTRDQVMRDYLNRRVSIEEDPVIPPETLAKINQSEREPDHIQILGDKFVIRWYISEEIRKSQAFKDKSIIVGCDSSEMIGRDSTTLIGIDPTTLETIFSFKCSEGNLNRTGVMIAQLLLMFPNFVLVPENKSSGTGFIDTVSLILRKEGHNPFYRVFNWVVNNRRDAEFAKIDLRDTSLLDTNIKRFFGIKTDKTKREELYSSTLLESADRACMKIRDKVLIQELNSLTVRNGRVDHAIGGHDDTVVAFLMAMWFILNGKNLELYGIKPGTVMSVVEKTKTDKTAINEAQQDMLRERIEDLEKAHRLQKDPSLRKLIEADITMFRSMVERGPVSVPNTADELNRDPRRFTDPVIAEQSRKPVYTEDFLNSIKALMQVK